MTPSHADHFDLIDAFYTAFATGNTEGMAACYHDQIRFSDPAFGLLTGPEVMAMWQMLLTSSRDRIRITCFDIQAGPFTGSARWVAEYRFGKKRRKVTNEVHALFEFKDGKIIRHTDEFNLWKWSQMALGTTGLLTGWTPWFRNKLQSQCKSRLHAFMNNPGN